jgi:hypothetical protein
MKIFVKPAKYFLLCTVAAVALVCFIFAMFFGVASTLSIAKVGLPEFIVLVAFFVLFVIAGNSFITVADILYCSIRRKAYG